MPDYRGDQAAGLRRLFGSGETRIVTFASANSGVGKSVLVANLAAALAKLGQQVVVVDESPQRGVAACLGGNARHDLLQVIDGEKTLDEVFARMGSGVRVLPVARAVKQLGQLNQRQQTALIDSLTGMTQPADVILVDASLDHPLGFSPFGLAAHEAVIVIAANSHSITDAYALIKKVSLGYARRRFRLLVNKGRSAAEAEAIHRNMAQVSQGRGLAHLAYAGFVPLDEQLRQALRLCQPVAELFPEARAARACQGIARSLLDWPLPEQNAGGLEHFVQHLLHLSQHIDPVPIYA